MANSAVEDFARGVVTSSGALTGANDDGAKTKIDPISIMAVVVPFITQLVTWVKQCKGLKNDQVQGYVASRHSSDKTRGPQEKQAAGKLLAHCKRLKREEIKSAKKLGVPPDTGRYELDDETALRVCHNMIGNFAAMESDAATDVVDAAITGG